MTTQEFEQIKLTRASRVQQLRDQLDRLLDLKLQELVDDDVFKAKQAGMKTEINELEQQAFLASDRQQRIETDTRRALDIATYGLSVLLHGSTKKKRTIARTIGSSFIALDGRIEIKVSDWLIPFGRATSLVAGPGTLQQPSIVTQVRTRQRPHFGSRKRKAAVSAAVCSLWQSIVDDVRTALAANIDSIDLPEWDEFGDLRE
ncbi:hypothetical protein ACFV98_38240 [Streptomyces violascens]|uniref:hypothetical protein n=1 Tax=Streptomyces violascens TaxID=67381 RepID=UPI003667A302